MRWTRALVIVHGAIAVFAFIVGVLTGLPRPPEKTKRRVEITPAA